MGFPYVPIKYIYLNLSRKVGMAASPTIADRTKRMRVGNQHTMKKAVMQEVMTRAWLLVLHLILFLFRLSEQSIQFDESRVFLTIFRTNNHSPTFSIKIARKGSTVVREITIKFQTEVEKLN